MGRYTRKEEGNASEETKVLNLLPGRKNFIESLTRHSVASCCLAMINSKLSQTE